MCKINQAFSKLCFLVLQDWYCRARWEVYESQVYLLSLHVLRIPATDTLWAPHDCETRAQHMPQLQMTEVAGRVEPSRCVVTSCEGGYSEHHDSGGLSLVVLTVAAGGLGPASSQDTGEMYLWLLYPVSVVLDSVCGLGNSRRIEGDNSIARIHCHLERPMSPVWGPQSEWASLRHLVNTWVKRSGPMYESSAYQVWALMHSPVARPSAAAAPLLISCLWPGLGAQAFFHPSYLALS